MPWVRFTENYEYRVNPWVIQVYQAGKRYLVKQACAEKAIAEGKAVRDGNSERPPK